MPEERERGQGPEPAENEVVVTGIGQKGVGMDQIDGETGHRNFIDQAAPETDLGKEEQEMERGQNDEGVGVGKAETGAQGDAQTGCGKSTKRVEKHKQEVDREVKPAVALPEGAGMQPDIAGQQIETHEGEGRIALLDIDGSRRHQPAIDGLEQKETDQEQPESGTRNALGKGVEHGSKEVEPEIALHKPVVPTVGQKERREDGKPETGKSEHQAVKGESDHDEEEDLKQELGQTEQTETDAVPTGKKHKDVDANDGRGLGKEPEQRGSGGGNGLGGRGHGQGPETGMHDKHQQHGDDAEQFHIGITVAWGPGKNLGHADVFILIGL